MKVSYTVYIPNTPVCDLYKQGFNYLVKDLDLGSEDAFCLLQELINSSDREDCLMIQSSSCSLDFHVSPDGSLLVEVFSNKGLWTISEIDLTTGEELLRIAQAGKDVGEIKPTTNKDWDDYTPLGN